MVERVLWEHEVAGSSPVFPTIFAGIAQTVEQLPCKHQVRGSIPRAGTRIKRAWRRDNVPGFHPGVKGLIPLVRTRICRGSSAVERRSHKPLVGGSIPSYGTNNGGLAHLVERLPCTQEVIGSSPISSTKFCSA